MFISSRKASRTSQAKAVLDEARPLFEAAKRDEIEPGDFNMDQLLTQEFKQGMYEIVKEIDRQGHPPRPARVHLMGPCIERPTVLTHIGLSQQDLGNLKRLRRHDNRRYRMAIYKWELPFYVKKNAYLLGKATMMRNYTSVNVATCEARLTESGGDVLVYLMKLLIKLARDLDIDAPISAYNIHLQRISGECIIILAQPDRIIMSVTRRLQAVVALMMIWVCGTFRKFKENEICYSSVSLDRSSTLLDLKDLKPLSHRYNINLLARRLFTNGIIFTKHDYANDHRFFQMSCEELLQRADKPKRYDLPKDRGVIFLGQSIALIPIAVDGDHNTVTWRCEICYDYRPQESFITQILIPELSPSRFHWDRTYLDRERDRDIRATTALVFHGRDRPALPLPGPTVIY